MKKNVAGPVNKTIARSSPESVTKYITFSEDRRKFCSIVFWLFKQCSDHVYRGSIFRPFKDFQPGGPVRQPYFSYRPVRLHRRNRFLGSINVYKYGLCTQHTMHEIYNLSRTIKCPFCELLTRQVCQFSEIGFHLLKHQDISFHSSRFSTTFIAIIAIYSPSPHLPPLRFTIS